MQNPYYMVEFKPALGWVFREYLEKYTHWAYGDLDVFFGDLTKGWLEASEMREYDVVTYRSNNRRTLIVHVLCAKFALAAMYISCVCGLDTHCRDKVFRNWCALGT